MDVSMYCSSLPCSLFFPVTFFFLAFGETWSVAVTRIKLARCTSNAEHYVYLTSHGVVTIPLQRSTWFPEAAFYDENGNLDYYTVKGAEGYIGTLDGRLKSPLATESLIENKDGVLQPPPPRGGVGAPHQYSLGGGSLLPSICADARYIDAVIVLQASQYHL